MNNFMEEFELTYLLKNIPKDLFDSKSERIIDRYIPTESRHPVIRLRKSGEKMELTKKEPIKEGDSSHQLEQTIILTQAEYNALEKIPAKVVDKTRYYYSFKKNQIEIDIFEGDLKGLILADVEFSSHEEKNNFFAPDFFLFEVTQAEIVAGGYLAGKKFEDIKNEIEDLQK